MLVCSPLAKIVCGPPEPGATNQPRSRPRCGLRQPIQVRRQRPCGCSPSTRHRPKSSGRRPSGRTRPSPRSRQGSDRRVRVVAIERKADLPHVVTGASAVAAAGAARTPARARLTPIDETTSRAISAPGRGGAATILDVGRVDWSEPGPRGRPRGAGRSLRRRRRPRHVAGRPFVQLQQPGLLRSEPWRLLGLGRVRPLGRRPDDVGRCRADRLQPHGRWRRTWIGWRRPHLGRDRELVRCTRLGRSAHESSRVVSRRASAMAPR